MTQFNVIVEISVPATREHAVEWVDALADYSPAVSSTTRGATEVVVTVPATTLRQAASTGWALFAEAPVSTFTVMPTAEFDRRADDVDLPELVGATEAAQMLGVTRQRVQQMAAIGALPSVRVGKALVFPRATVEAMAGPTHPRDPRPQPAQAGG